MLLVYLLRSPRQFRATSTCSLYSLKWGVFKAGCTERNVIPYLGMPYRTALGYCRPTSSCLLIYERSAAVTPSIKAAGPALGFVRGPKLWVMEAIVLCYNNLNIEPPKELQANSTKGIATSWALFKGISIQKLCAVASWSSLHTFVRLYRLDVTQSSLAHVS